MNKQDELEIRKIIKTELDKFSKSINKDVNLKIDKQITKVNSHVDKTISELKKELTNQINALKKEGLNKEKIIDLLSKAFKQQNKFMWEKSDFITQFLKTI